MRKHGDILKDATKEGQFPKYKDRPLVRNGNTLYYGDMRERYVAKIDIKTATAVNDLTIADRVVVQLMDTNPDEPQKVIVKTSEKKGLYLALDIADIWLTRYC